MRFVIYAIFFALAFPFGVLLGTASLLLRATLKVSPNQIEVSAPENAILFWSHPRLYCLALSREVLSGGKVQAKMIGYHGFIPYIWVFHDHMTRLPYYLFDRFSETPPAAQIMNQLNSNPRCRFGIATDSGGPYGKVRGSLIKLSIESNRPLVGISATVSRYFTIYHHHIPIPFSTITFFSLPPISPSELKALPFDSARARLQRDFDILTTL